MVHAVSATYLRFERMSPSAMALAMLLHASVALALWQISPLRTNPTTESQPIEITMERAEPPAPPPVETTPPPAPPAPSPPPAPPPAAQRTPPPQLGVRPPAPETAEKREQAPPKPEEKEEPRQEALAPAPAPTPPPPAPKLEDVLPPIEAPPPPVFSREIPKTAPPKPPPAPKPAPPVQQARPPAQNPPLRPSPLTPHSRPPNPQASAPSTTFVNPADQATRSRVAEQYLWQVVRKMSQYLPDLRVEGQTGRIGLKLVIARDGRLIEASIAQSSGHAILDKAMLETARTAAPYAPLPPELGDRVTLNVPLAAARR